MMSVGQSKLAIKHNETINQVFTLLRLNYSNQYFKAYDTKEAIKMVKLLWSNALKDFSSNHLLQATHQILINEKFLPTLHTMITYSRNEVFNSKGLPDVEQAFTEACLAQSPKKEQKWSHPAVYWAGVESQWFDLASQPKNKMFPLFKRHYLRLCNMILSDTVISLSNRPQQQNIDFFSDEQNTLG